ncbi:hypothetical protein AA0311_1857 [Asaia bogorensis NBRC 16594]|uniref:Uncharacterized protein n=1 Tax=Asaia bogorensis NBRC 16594 TaxID=1231624 RepID=A0AAN4R482_9PROT|nr:hypothetical protein AA0311_1857 [Asaia bogorensis NBRC 16594]GEL54038.1 hypothetical protein ABO01nite_20450 [Asaia bogorensis NBRC 16594]
MNVIQKKTGARLSIPIYPALAEINAKEPSPDATYLQNQAGLQASANGLGNQFRAPANAAGVTAIFRVMACEKRRPGDLLRQAVRHTR